MREIIFIKNINNSFDGIETPYFSDVTGEIKPLGKIPIINKQLFNPNTLQQSGLNISITLLLNDWLVNLKFPNDNDIINYVIYYDVDGNILELDNPNYEIGTHGIYSKETILPKLSKYIIAILNHNDNIEVTNINYKDYFEYVGFIDSNNISIKNSKITIHTFDANSVFMKATQKISYGFNDSNYLVFAGLIMSNYLHSESTLKNIIDKIVSVTKINFGYNILNNEIMEDTTGNHNEEWIDEYEEIANKQSEAFFNFPYASEVYPAKLMWFGYDSMAIKTQPVNQQGAYQYIGYDSEGNWDIDIVKHSKIMEIEYKAVRKMGNISFSIHPIEEIRITHYVLGTYFTNVDQHGMLYDLTQRLIIIIETVIENFHPDIVFMENTPENKDKILSTTIIDQKYPTGNASNSNYMPEILAHHNLINSATKVNMWHYIESGILSIEDTLDKYLAKLYGGDGESYELVGVNAPQYNATTGLSTIKNYISQGGNTFNNGTIEWKLRDYKKDTIDIYKYDKIILLNSQVLKANEIIKTILTATKTYMNIGNNLVFNLVSFENSGLTPIYLDAIEMHNVEIIPASSIEYNPYVDYMYIDNKVLFSNTKNSILESTINIFYKNNYGNIKFIANKETVFNGTILKVGDNIYMSYGGYLTGIMYIISIESINEQLNKYSAIMVKSNSNFWRDYAKQLFNLG